MRRAYSSRDDSEPAVRGLSIDLFGDVSVVDLDAGHEFKLPHASQELIGCLAMHAAAQPIRRERLAELLWPDCTADASRCRLRTALWRLRSGLGEGLNQTIRQDNERVWLSADIVARPRHIEFAQELEAVCAVPIDEMTRSEFDRLTSLLRLYVGPIMDGFESEWIMPEREHHHEIYMRGLDRELTWYRAHGNHDATVAAARSLLKLDPYREDIHAMLIGLYAALGQQKRAVKQYHDCDIALREDLGIVPNKAREALSLAISGHDLEDMPAFPCQTRTKARPPAGKGKDVAAVLAGIENNIRDLSAQIAALRDALSNR